MDSYLLYLVHRLTAGSIFWGEELCRNVPESGSMPGAGVESPFRWDLGLQGPVGGWEHFPRILDVGKDWDSSELWTAHFSLAFSNIINSSSTVRKILSIHTVKDGVLKDGVVCTGRAVFSLSGVSSCLRPTRAGLPLEDGNSRLGPGQGSTFEHFTRIAGLWCNSGARRIYFCCQKSWTDFFFPMNLPDFGF